LNDYSYDVFLNNIFIFYKLFAFLKEKGYGVIDTAKINLRVYKSFINFKKQDKKKDKIVWNSFKKVVIINNKVV